MPGTNSLGFPIVRHHDERVVEIVCSGLRIMENGWLATVVSLTLVIISGMGLATLIFLTWSSTYFVTVVSHSMSPTLMEGDRVVIWRAWPHRWLRRGQIVLVWPWTSTSENLWARGRGNRNFVPYIKRLVALEGDTIVTSLDDLSEIDQKDVMPQHDSSGKRIWQIPPGHLFVVGDNRPGGNDSLLWGPLPTCAVMGVAVVKLSRKGTILMHPLSHRGMEKYYYSTGEPSNSLNRRKDS